MSDDVTATISPATLYLDGIPDGQGYDTIELLSNGWVRCSDPIKYDLSTSGWVPDDSLDSQTVVYPDLRVNKVEPIDMGDGDD